jgi:hypothetical protein
MRKDEQRAIMHAIADALLFADAVEISPAVAGKFCTARGYAQDRSALLTDEGRVISLGDAARPKPKPL